MANATWSEEGIACERDLVARIQRDTVCPMLADVFHQYRVMKAVAEQSSTAVPQMLFAEPDARLIGDPFYRGVH